MSGSLLIGYYQELAIADSLAFNMQDVFPPDELLSEWIATLALAFNDVSLVHARMVEDQDSAHEFFYWLRLAISHFSEAAAYLIHTREIPEVKEFVASLPAAAQENYITCMNLYELRTSEIQQIRNVAAFHYPELRPSRRNRLMAWALRELADERGIVRRGKVIEARMLFADDIVSKLFVRSTPTWKDVGRLHRDIEGGLSALMRFANPAIEAFFLRAVERGAKLTPWEPPAAGRQ